MIRSLISTYAIGITIATAEPTRSGHAAVEWLAESATVQGGQTLRTAVRMTIDAPWHTYWVNAGEGGMPTGFSWKLPDGWQVSSVSHPVPKRFLTGELVGYGHEGSVWFPVEITSPKDFSGMAELQSTMTWLACNDEACVPGEAVIRLSVSAGEQESGPHAAEIAREFEKRPLPVDPSTRLTVEASDGGLVLRITGTLPFDPTTATVFAVTPEIMDPAAVIRFGKTTDGWEANAPKSPYAKDAVSGLELLLVPPLPHRAVILGQTMMSKP